MREYFERAVQQLQKHWGYPGFREGQDRAVQSVFDGRDTMVLFPTGGGKSLCYQVPALVLEGVTVVISPLVALMQDQVQQLKDRGISATFINSTLPGYEVEQRLVNARNGMYKLLYCAPERLSTPLFQAELENLNISLVAVDEAHCISEWGHDFRPSYRKIREALSGLPDSTRWLALTATATPEVQADILKNLEFVEPEVVSAGFARPNLVWWVLQTEDKRGKLLQLVKRAAEKGDGLIYGGTRKNCEYWANTMARQGVKAEAYHAGIESEERKAIQERWISGETPWVASTNAFGMGIDKPNCRYVFHEEMPFSLEAYYQEAGRAGRDGETSYPMLLYRESDYLRARARLEENYPTREELQRVYNALCDELGLAVGSEMLTMSGFELERLKTRSAVPINTIRAGLRLMDQFGVIAVNQAVPARFSLQFTLSRDMLSVFKQRCQNPDKAEFLDKIERIFGAQAFYDMVEVEEEFLIEKMQVSRNSLIKGLNVLMQHDSVLMFTGYKAQDLVRLLEARSVEVPIPKKEIETYRSSLLQKLDWMHGYATTNECREVYLLKYFGQMDAKPCGKCDNCTKESDFEEITPDEVRRCFNALIQQGKSIEEVKNSTGWTKAKLKSVVNYLISERLIEPSTNKPGYYQLPV